MTHSKRLPPVCSSPSRSRGRPPSTTITPELIAAARREGKIALYSGLDLPLSEKLAKGFEAKHPGIAVRVERSGAERIFQRIGQEQASSHLRGRSGHQHRRGALRRLETDGLARAIRAARRAQHFAPDDRDADGMHATLCFSLSGLGYNTKLVKPEDAPKRFADLLNPKWKGRIVKAHPSYSGTILTTTFALSQRSAGPSTRSSPSRRVMQVQSAGDPPKKLALGERAVQADGVDAILEQLKEQGQPVEFVYAAEGTPLITDVGRCDGECA